MKSDIIKQKFIDTMCKYPDILWAGFRDFPYDQIGTDGAIVLMGTSNDVDNNAVTTELLEEIYSTQDSGVMSYYLDAPPDSPYSFIYKRGVDW